ncbi:MAG: replicative DNA helicase [Burkholderiales bacterium]|nr:replicative DNA helicase [Burkholderiales bacterium]
MSARDLMDDDVSGLRVPPHSVEAEQSVLGGLLLDNRAWDRAGDLLVDSDFYRFEHRLIYAAIGGLISATKPADVITVFEHLERTGKDGDAGGKPYLNALAQSVPSAANMRRYAEIVRERAVQRATIAALDAALTSAWASQEVDFATTLDQLTTELARLQRRHMNQAPRSIAEIAIARLDHYTDVQQGNVAPAWPTHIPALDRWLNGGVRPGSLIILAARPGMGKTSLAWSISKAFASDGLPVLFCSMEMTTEDIGDRAVSNAGRVSYGAILGGKMTDSDWGGASEGVELLARLPLFVDDQGALTLQQIRLKAKSIKGLRILVVDYLQLMATTRRDRNRNAEIEEISRGLKALAKELGIVVLALSQLNRNVEARADKRPGLADLRDSGALEADADVVAFMWAVRSFAGEGRKIVGFAIDKNRTGRIGEVGLDFYGDTQTWAQSTADIRPQPPTRGGDL